MSYTILQSTKVFHLIDRDGNGAYISGTVAESNNVSPKTYDRIHFHRATKTKEELSLEAVQYAQGIITGCIQLKSSNAKTLDDEVDTAIRRFLRNVKLAKTVNVEKIHFEDNRACFIFGLQGKTEINALEPTFYFYDEQLNGEHKVYLAKHTDEHQAAFDFLQSDRTVEKAIEISKSQPHIASLFKPATLTEDQLITLITNLDDWNYDRLISKTATRLNQASIDKLVAAMPDKFRYFKPDHFLSKEPLKAQTGASFTNNNFMIR